MVFLNNFVEFIPALTCDFFIVLLMVVFVGLEHTLMAREKKDKPMDVLELTEMHKERDTLSQD